MEERLRRRVLFRRGLALLPVAACAAPARAEPAKPVSAEPPKTGPFADVPAGHPAYATLHYLEKLGLWTGFPVGIFGGRGALTRYEFAVALQRVFSVLGRAVSRLETLVGAEPVVLVGVPARDPSDDRLLRPILSDPDLFERVTGWLEALLLEFRSELRMLGVDLPKLEKQVPEWRRRVEEHAARRKDNPGLPPPAGA